METKDFFPLVNVLAGGLLTLIGGLLVARITDERKMRVERTQRRLQQLESIYKSIEPLHQAYFAVAKTGVDWLLQGHNQLDDRVLKAREHWATVEMLIRFYAPALEQHVDQIPKHVAPLITEFTRVMLLDRSTLSDTKKMELANQLFALFGPVERAFASLKTEAAAQATKINEA